MTKSLFKHKFHLDLYVTLHPSFPPTTFYLQCRMNIHVWIHPGKTFSVTTQVNFSLSENFASLERAKLWTISCIRPNDSGSPNSFDKHRVISQIRSLLLPDLTARKTTDYVADYELLEFCERYYIPTTMRGWEEERIIQCARANGWKERARLWTISCI